jgi:hypothetical protein
MKKLAILLAFITITLLSFGQTGRVYRVDVDTLNGSETVNFAAREISGGYTTLAIQALCTEIGGTSDGTLLLQGSVDGTSFVTQQDATGVLQSYPNDTLTITDGAIVQYIIQGTPMNFYRVQGAGTASDSTLVTVKYTYK